MSDGAIEQGTYEVLRGRLVEQARALRTQVEGVNARRLELFGGQEMEVIGSEKIRTKNACLPRDIVSIGNDLLFGYEVKLGLKSEVDVDDVLALYNFRHEDGVFEFKPLSSQVDDGDGLSLTPKFLGDPGFLRDFRELFKYYKQIRLLQLRLVQNGTVLLAVFQIGSTINDVKALKWGVAADGEVKYIDNRGERDNAHAPQWEFSWEVAGRDQFVNGKHPHVSILNEVFVETVGGDLTVKVENNTEDGLGIYSEKVDDARQGLADAQFHYKKLGPVILLKILPYREQTWRYLIFNTRSQTVHNVKAIGDACVSLPDDHGLIFPGGYYLQEGVLRNFEGDYAGMSYEATVRSPNGEDVLYVFRHREQCRFALMAYNMIQKEVRPPIHCNGYTIYEDGTMVLFRSPTDGEPSRVQTMQIWRTAFFSSEFNLRQQGKSGSYLESIGNAELVRGVSDALSVARRVEEQQPSLAVYEDLVSALSRMADVYPWLGHEEVGNLLAPLGEIKRTATLVLEEFDKVVTLKKAASKAFEEASKSFNDKARRMNPDDFRSVEEYVEALAFLRTARGQLITLKDMRYAPLDEINAIEQKSIEKFDVVSQRAVEFLLGPGAFAPLQARIEEQAQAVDSLQKAGDAVPLAESLETIGSGLELLMDVIGGLKIDDATQRTAVLEKIAELMGSLNRARALVAGRRKELGSKESTAEFAVQFQLLTQNATSSINLADSPEKCEAALSRLMLQVEDLEGRFGEYEDYLEQLTEKREDISKSITAKKQTLVEARQRRVSQLLSSADRILDGLGRRAATITDTDQLNAFFASDAMVMKVREVAERLRELKDPVKADELESRLKAARQESGRSLRDRQEIFEEGSAVIKFGRHRFSVNTEPVELTTVPRRVDGGAGEQLVMALHITGTDYFEDIQNAELDGTREFWEQQLVSETPQVYRAEYLAYCMLDDAEVGLGGLSLKILNDAVLEGGERLLNLVRSYTQNRYDEGYDRGIHDADATLILTSLLSLYASARHLRFSGRVRHAALLWWSFGLDDAERKTYTSQCMSFKLMMSVFGPSDASDRLAREIGERVSGFASAYGVRSTAHDSRLAGEYLVEDLGDGDGKFLVSGNAISLRDAFLQHLQSSGVLAQLQAQWSGLRNDLKRSYELVLAWLDAFVATNPTKQPDEHLQRWQIAVEEAAALLLTEGKSDRETSSSNTAVTVDGLLGQHNRVVNRQMEIRLEEFVARLDLFRQERVPAFRAYQALRRDLLAKERARLKLDEIAPTVMSAFVRNKLINEIYLPLIGDNLAKQMGSLGVNKRTDQMGMLLLISPPGYGKTTLMEYVANRLGLIFVKINGPALGHGVVSLDPAEATSATAKQEVQKVNFALEMGNNVMLYLDDIQHTNPEFLQKFISLCDAQRKIEGVWKGRTRTYDLKGKRFCICMAGNPYTESGARFQIPDMLANRADTYNLGDVMQGKEALFELSYLENALTSNPTLAPLTSREPEDVYKLIRMAEGLPINANELSHNYSSVELEEILSVMRKLFRVQKLLLKVNQTYIHSAATDDAYRTEPSFKLQGSYRNMTKLTEKVVAIMNDQELERLIEDHYTGEAQTLTTGAEHNLLKLAELRDVMTDVQKLRWDEIKRGFGRRQTLGGEDDPVLRVSAVLGKVSENLDAISHTIHEASAGSAALMEKFSQGPMLVQLSSGDAEVFAPPAAPGAELAPVLTHLDQTLTAMGRVLAKPPEAAALTQIGAALEQLGRINLAGGSADLGPVLQGLQLIAERLPAATATGSALPAAANVELAPIFDRLAGALDRLGRNTVPPPAVVAAAAVAGESAAVPTHDPFVASALDRMGEVLDRLSRQDPTPVLRQLAGALERIGSGGLAVGAAPAAVASPISGAASPAPISLSADASSALVGSMDHMMHLVPRLRQLGERLRGPKARVILMDPGLVRAFDGLKDAASLADLVKALEALDLP